MATQLYDSNGNPITGATASPDQQVADSNGSLINPAKEDGNLASIKTDTDKFTFASTRLLVDGSGVTQPISGTITANAGTGTFTVGQATGTNLHAVIDSGTITVGNATLAVTQSGTWNINNISGTISLPTGASTSAKQPALGTAGTASADVITVQGIASMIALKVDGSAVTQPISGTVTANIGTSGSLALDASVTGLEVSQGSTTSGQKGILILAAATNAAPSYTDAQTSPLTVTLAGRMRVDLGGFGGTAVSLGQKTMASSMPVVIASDNGIIVAQGSTTSGQSGNLIQGAVTTAAPSYTTAQTSPLSLDTSGRLRIDNSSWIGSTAPTVGQKTMANSIPVVVSSDQTVIALDATVAKLNITQGTALGSNTGPMVMGSVTTADPVYTTGQISPLSLTTNGELRVETESISQNHVISGSAFVLATGLVTNGGGNGTDLGMIYLHNPSGSTKTLYLTKLTIGNQTANKTSMYKIFYDPTGVSGGTSVTPVNLKNGNGTASQTDVFAKGTFTSITTLGTVVYTCVNGQNPVANIIDLDRMFVIPPNHSVLVTAQGSAALDVGAALEWTEI